MAQSSEAKGKTLGTAQTAQTPPEREAPAEELDDLVLDGEGVGIECEPIAAGAGTRASRKFRKQVRQRCSPSETSKASPSFKMTPKGARLHTVEKGESLWKIAEATFSRDGRDGAERSTGAEDQAETASVSS